MSDQLGLPGLGDEDALFVPETPAGMRRAASYSLFLALIPQPADAVRLAALADTLRMQHGLQGRCLPAERLHVTLAALAQFQEAESQAVIDAALAVTHSARGTALEVVFDHLVSFGTSGSRPLMLGAAEPTAAAIAALRTPLVHVARQHGLRPQASTEPHMTLLYDRRAVPRVAIEPVRWVADRVMLVLSHVGIGHHQWLHEQPLA